MVISTNRIHAILRGKSENCELILPARAIVFFISVLLKKKFDGFGKQFEVAYQMVELRKQKKMSQNDLAKKIGTTQSNIARMETGKQNFSMAILLKMASAFKKELKINFV